MAKRVQQSANLGSYRWEVAARVLLAFIGGFIWVSTFGGFIATTVHALGWMPLPQAVHVMTLFSFIAWCAIAMWAFQAPQLKRLAGWLLGSAAMFFLLQLALERWTGL
ncbi:MAG: hypothetical protein AAGG11_20435 [Pseudomonadota bacterium]